MKFISEKRIWTDEVTFTKLGSFFEITRGYIKRDSIYDAIISEWIDSGGDIKVGNVILGQYSLKGHLIWMRVDESLWNNFKTQCYMRDLDVNAGFKIAAYRFLDKVYKDGSILGYKIYNDDEKEYDNGKEYYDNETKDSISEQYAICDNDIQVKRFKINLEDISNLPHCSGIYIFTTESGKRYIGRSLDIRKRVSLHASSRIEFDPINYVSFFEFIDYEFVKVLETALIRELSPELNR